MITQAVLDFLRDVVLNWVSGVGSLASGVGASAAGAAIGGVAAQAGHFLALFISPGVWPAIVTAWGIWLVVWLTTGLIAIVARRGTSA
jgi:hypothetical protein